MKMFSKINTIEKKLASAAMLLAALALIAGHPVNFIEYPDYDIKDITIEERHIKLISVTALANWITEKRNDFIIVDMRSNELFDKYHIPDAINLEKNTDLQSAGKLKLIFYNGGESIPANINSIFSNNNESGIYILDGGMDMWKRIILFPDLTHMKVNDKKQIEKIVSTSRYFGGRPKLPQRMQPKSSDKYLREGC
jgi:rhodanese-related sulfurtransferase